MMKFRSEVAPFLLVSFLFALIVGLIGGLFGFSGLTALIAALLTFVIFGGYMLYFFRDPSRIAPDDPSLVLAGADGHVARLTTLDQDAFRRAATRSGLSNKDMALFGESDVLRISIFLSLFDVHVNRMPFGGTARFLGYFPGKRLFTFDEKSSDQNQHNAILIVNERLSCLLTQIVGPVCRRVVYWLDHDEPHSVKAGQSFGMMKFGSRLDMYYPADRIELICRQDQFVMAGESVIAKIIPKGP
jgi:phosphatidylserine decarboxylase